MAGTLADLQSFKMKFLGDTILQEIEFPKLSLILAWAYNSAALLRCTVVCPLQN